MAQEERDSEDAIYDNPYLEERHSIRNGRKASAAADGLWDGVTFAGKSGKSDARARGDKWCVTTVKSWRGLTIVPHS